MTKKLVTLAALAMLLGSPSSYADFFRETSYLSYAMRVTSITMEFVPDT